MADLHALGVLDMSFAGKELRRIWNGSRLLVEGIERAAECAGDGRFQSGKILPLLRIETEEIKSLGQLRIVVQPRHVKQPLLFVRVPQLHVKNQ